MAAIQTSTHIADLPVMELQRTTRVWKADGTIDGVEVDLAQAIILLCDRTRELRNTADRVALIHELQESMKAFLSKDFTGARYHMEQAIRWRDAIVQK